MTTARTKSFAWVALALVAAVAAIYAPVRSHSFLDFDDMAYLVWNPGLEPGSTAEAVRIALFEPFAAGWMPLTVLSHQIERWLFGVSAPATLLINVGLHALASVWLFAALRRLSGHAAAAAFAAGVFAVHPLHVESVAWAISRKDVLSGLCFAALLWLYARYTEAPERPGRYRAVLVALAAGLMSKPTLVTAPFVLLLLDAWPLRRLDREAWREKLPMFAMVALVCLATIHFQRAGDAFDFGTGLPLWARVANAVDAVGRYLVATVWPAGLAAFYPHPGTEIGFARVLVSAAALVGLTALALRIRTTQPFWLVGWLWFLGMLVPVSGLLQVGMQARADRYTYLPLIGLAWAVGLGAEHLAATRGRRRAAAAFGLAALTALGVAAARQVHVWRDSRTLYARIQALHPESWFPALRLGMVEVIAGRFDAARPELERALALHPAAPRRLFHQIGSLAAHQRARGRHEAARATLDFGIDLAARTGHRDEAMALRLQRSAS